MRFLLALTLAAATAGPAAAEPLFDRISGASASADPCFARAYDPAHMRQRPRQLVTRFLLRRQRVEVEAENSARRFTIVVTFALRNSNDTFSTNAICTPRGDRAACVGEGDTGAFEVSPSGQGLRVDVQRLEVEGDTSFSPNLAASDDRIFLLQPAELELCGAGTD
jgi:hypothetical protein